MPYKYDGKESKILRLTKKDQILLRFIGRGSMGAGIRELLARKKNRECFEHKALLNGTLTDADGTCYAIVGTVVQINDYSGRVDCADKEGYAKRIVFDLKTRRVKRVEHLKQWGRYQRK